MGVQGHVGFRVSQKQGSLLRVSASKDIEAYKDNGKDNGNYV